jgi:hypothetical protein
VVNYLCLVIMNVGFYIVDMNDHASHMVDAVGITAFVIVAITFFPLHAKTGLWKLTHAKTENLDERQVQITYNALSISYGWFTVICLVIMMGYAVSFRLFPGLGVTLTIPLVGSLIYLAHTLPGSILAWTETEVPAEAK